MLRFFVIFVCIILEGRVSPYVEVAGDIAVQIGPLPWITSNVVVTVAVHL